MRILLTLQYLGTAYAGWQRQTNAVGVQQVVEEALGKMFGAPIRIEGASRTDSGVHAVAQRAHVDVPFEIAPRGMVRGLNDFLPSDIRVVAAETVADDFHCRFDANGKSYVYRIWNSEVEDVFAAPTHVLVSQPLDVPRMSQAVQAIIGEHDFAAFTVAGPEVSSTIRTVHAAGVERENEAIRIFISADGFLRYMVRRIAGSLIEVGRGKLDTDALVRSLGASPEPARWTAPSKGLILLDVRY